MTKIPSIPLLNTEKKTRDFIKHLEIISLLHGLKMSHPEDFKQIFNIYRISQN